MRKATTFGILLVLLMAFAPLSGADEIGASGGCWDESGAGGSALVRLNDGQLEHEGLGTGDPDGVVGAAQALGNDDVDTSGDTPNPCTSDDEYSYIEVHGDVAGTEAQVCYNGELHTDAGACPTTPPDREPIPGDYTVQIGTVTSCGFANYAPSSLAVQVGEAVEWENVDNCAHTATADDDSFDTGTLNSGATSNGIVFDTPGTYAYGCNFHPNMSGEIVVS